MPLIREADTATDTGQFDCNRETVGELREIRKELEGMR